MKPENFYVSLNMESMVSRGKTNIFILSFWSSGG